MACGGRPARRPIGSGFRDLFNGKDLTGWVNVNTDEDTWTVKDGILICKGQPIGVMRSDKQYENFILHIEWKHIEAGGNSGVFVWSDAKPGEKNRLPNGVEVQMLELDAITGRKGRDGQPLSPGYVHGDLFGVGGVEIVPDNPRGVRSSSLENRAKGRGEWNTYDVVAIDGVIKLAVNGKLSTASANRRTRRAICAWNQKARRFTFATSRSWNCCRESPRLNSRRRCLTEVRLRVTRPLVRRSRR
jgi:hypothetical protein